MKKFWVIVLSIVSVGCSQTHHFNGPANVRVEPDAWFVACRGGESWTEGNHYAIRLHDVITVGIDSHREIELHGLNSLMVQHGDILSADELKACSRF
jgi:hypothetical protein